MRFLDRLREYVTRQKMRVILAVPARKRIVEKHRTDDLQRLLPDRFRFAWGVAKSLDVVRRGPASCAKFDAAIRHHIQGRHILDDSVSTCAKVIRSQAPVFSRNRG